MATIRARYEKGVFTPLEPLELEEGCEVDVSVPADEQDLPERAGNRDLRDLIDDIANLHKKYPPGTFDHVPPDLSANIDHYAYGLPKRTDEE